MHFHHPFADTMSQSRTELCRRSHANTACPRLDGFRQSPVKGVFLISEIGCKVRATVDQLIKHGLICRATG